MIIPNLSISRVPRTPLRCAIALESEMWDPVAAALRSGFMLDKSAIATGTLVTTQFPIAMLFTLLTPSLSQVRPNNPPTVESVFSTVRPNVFTLLRSISVLGDPYQPSARPDDCLWKPRRTDDYRSVALPLRRR